MTFFNGAISRFRVLSPGGYNPPKMKFQYYINFVTKELNNQNQSHLSYFVKRIDRLSMSYTLAEMNQYNKKRLVQTKVEYNPISFTFYDVVDGTAIKLIEAYNRFYYDDFLSKSDNSWNYDIIGGSFENSPGWGLAGRQSPNNNYFLDRIEIYEMYDQYYSKMSFINPKFASVEMGNLGVEDFGTSEITISTRFEGVVFDEITEIITPELSDLFGLPYYNDNFTSLGNGLNVSGPDLTSGVSLPTDSSSLSTLANILNNSVNGGLVSPAFNLVNNVLSSSTGQINGVLGSLIGGSVPNIFSVNSVNSSNISSVSNIVSSGDAARSVTTGVFNVSQLNTELDV